MTRVDEGCLRREPFASRPACANGHVWRPETTRWRRRGPRGRHTAEVERDCLVCKAVSEGKRRARRAVDRRYV